MLRRIDGKSYSAYRDILGRWDLGDGITLWVDHVQGDPFAAPSRVRVTVPLHVKVESEDRIAAEDFLARRFAAGLGPTPRRGSGSSGAIRVYRPGPEVCDRSTLRLSPAGNAEVRFAVGLPARGRRILGREAQALLIGDVADAAHALELDAAARASFDAHVASVRRQRALRSTLTDHQLVGFIEDGSVLPRTDGISQTPLPGAVPFTSPPSLRVELTLPDGEVVRGMGIHHGVTLIVGGGFHGKSTVLAALQRGHLDHVPGDGREGVVTLLDTVKIRAEDGRRVAGVDISAFLRDLPGGALHLPLPHRGRQRLH